MNSKKVFDSKKWALVSDELASEQLKLKSYDDVLIKMLGDVSGQKVLDYGPGPAVLASALQKMGADVKTWDIDPKMNEICAERIGVENAYTKVSQIPSDYFDAVVCNLVLCIDYEPEVRIILKNIKRALRSGGSAFIGFCNPRLHNVKETNLDIRQCPGRKYEENHVYTKVKKEGNYEILEMHRPIEWYIAEYLKAGFILEDVVYTPEYELKGNKINDFIVFKLTKK